mgnify:FL=1
MTDESFGTLLPLRLETRISKYPGQIDNRSGLWSTYLTNNSEMFWTDKRIHSTRMPFITPSLPGRDVILTRPLSVSMIAPLTKTFLRT